MTRNNMETLRQLDPGEEFPSLLVRTNEPLATAERGEKPP
jgi:hypothetical protein